MKKYLKIVLFNICLFALLLIVFECFLLVLVRNPALLKRCPRKIRNSIGYLYAVGDRRVIQFTPECARHDDTFGYTLKPGTCTFSGREFSNRYSVNSLGVRDDEASLSHPEIIVAGDSFAMGWGVEQEETFAQLIEGKTGLTVLNAAVSSYGTVREMMILRRVPTDHLKYLIIQYCANDYEENKEFYLNHNHLYTMGAEDYQRYTQINNKTKEYFLGKYLFLKVKKKISELKQRKTVENKPIDKDDADLFINALIHSQLDLTNVKIIVFQMNGHDYADTAFIDALKKKISASRYPLFIKGITVLDVSKVLTENHFYVLDAHLNGLGHEAVARELLKIIQNTSTEHQGIS